MKSLPKRVYLRAMKKEWRVAYVSYPGKLMIVEHANRQLIIYGKHYSKKAARHLLTRWVILKAHHFLNDNLKRLSRRLRVKYKKMIIRAQEAQWGSYSSNKTISLNYQLVFLPPALMQHVLLHELCHVVHMDHSDFFWQHLARYDRRWKSHREKLNNADHFIPQWLNHTDTKS